MSRKVWIYLHLFTAAFLSPAILLVAVSGGLYLFGIKGTTTRIPVQVPRGVMIDLKSDTLDGDVYQALRQSGVRHDFEYVKVSGSTLYTRPTSKPYYQISVGRKQLTITRHEPDLQKTLIELHKGHGPLNFKLLQKVLAGGLAFVILTGLVLGLTSPGLRVWTLLISIAGGGVFVAAALL